MKLNRMITMCAVALALAMSIGDAFAQINNGGGNGGGGGGGGGGGFGNGGGRRNRGGNGGNFDPAQMQQRRLDNVRQQLDFTNDADWSAVQPLVQKVLDAQTAARQGGQRGGFGGGGRRAAMAAPMATPTAAAAAASANSPTRIWKRSSRRLITMPRQNNSRLCSPNTMPRKRPSRPPSRRRRPTSGKC